MIESSTITEPGVLSLAPVADLKPSNGDNAKASWNFRAENIPSDTAHMEPEETEALLNLFNWCTDPRHPLSMKEAAAQLECSPGLLYQLLTGKYRNDDADKTPKRPSAEFMRRLNNFLDQESRKYAAAGLEFVHTETSARVALACRLARESRTPVLLEGPSHVGKSWGLRHWTSDPANGPCFMIEILGPGKTLLVRTTARTLGIASKFTDLQRLFNSICGRITPGSVVAFDEFHLLALASEAKFLACETWIRRLYDAKQCGMVFSFTHLKNINDEAMVQLRRRCVHHIKTASGPTEWDIGSILYHNGFRGNPATTLVNDRRMPVANTAMPSRELIIPFGKASGQPYKILRDLSASNGLKSITERIRYAKILAGKRKQEVGWSHFVDAHLRIQKQAEQTEGWS